MAENRERPKAAWRPVTILQGILVSLLLWSLSQNSNVTEQTMENYLHTNVQRNKVKR